MKPKYSVITAVYNREDCVRACLESVASQDAEVAFEHIVVDDGSTDATAEIVEEFASSHPYVTLIRLPHNQGPNAARNAAVCAAHGDFIVSLDSDDQMAEGAMKEIDVTVQNHPEFGHYLFAISGRDQVFAEAGYAPNGEYELSFKDFLYERLKGDFVHVIQRQSMLEMPYMAEMRIHEGVFNLRFLKRAGRILFTNKVLINVYLGRDDRVSQESYLTKRIHLERHIKSLELRQEWFADDYMQDPEGIRQMAASCESMFKYHILLGNHTAAEQDYRKIRASGFKPKLLLRLLWKARLGQCAFSALKVKYKLRKLVSKIKS